jgi:peroxiredoxin
MVKVINMTFLFDRLIRGSLRRIMGMKNKRLIIALIMTVLVVPQLTFCFPGVSQAQTAMKRKIGEKAPDFTLKSLPAERGGEYGKISLSDYIGKKVILLEFWATWCDICVGEIPTLVKDYEEFKDKGFEILAITLQAGEEEDIWKLKEQHNITYPILLDERLKVATRIYGLAGPIPLKVVIDCDGIIQYSHVGDYPVGENELPFVIEDLIQGCPDPVAAEAPAEGSAPAEDSTEK